MLSCLFGMLSCLFGKLGAVTRTRTPQGALSWQGVVPPLHPPSGEGRSLPLRPALARLTPLRPFRETLTHDRIREKESP